MDTASFRTLFDYNGWANARVLAAAAQLSPAQFVAPAGLSHGSVRGTLVHVLGTEWMWRQRYQLGVSPPALPDEAAYGTLAAIHQWANEEAAAVREFLTGLDDAALVAPVHYTNTRGTAFATPLWQILTHIVNHGTQFRSETAVALSQAGHSPGDLDFIAFVRSQPQETTNA
ncbi:MAG: DinB family protein [Chloroflexales bacterium]|nr:DinB family protein [Chloroflexales bacterium]